MRSIVLYTALVVMLLILCYITLVIYSHLGLVWAVVFSIFEAVKTAIACIFYVRLIARD